MFLPLLLQKKNYPQIKQTHTPVTMRRSLLLVLVRTKSYSCNISDNLVLTMLLCETLLSKHTNTTL